MPKKAAQNTLFTLPQSIGWWFTLLGGLVAATLWKQSLRRPELHQITYPTALADARYLPASLAVPGAEFEGYSATSSTKQNWKVAEVLSVEASPKPETIEKSGWDATRTFSIYTSRQTSVHYVQVAARRFARIEM